MSDNRQVEDLLKKGIEAAKAKDNATARALLEQVVQMDQHNEKAWFWLAAVTDEIEEKRICLGNVLVINPNNTRAQKLLRQLEKEEAAEVPDDDLGLDAPPPSPRRKSQRSGGGRRSVLLLVFVLIVVIALGAIFALMSSGGDDNDTDDTAADDGSPVAADTIATSAPGATIPDAATLTALPSSIPGTNMPDIAVPTNTALPTLTPVPSITATKIVPTWTPRPRPTTTPEVPPTLFPPPPSTLGGGIVMQSGQVPGDNVNHPIVLIKPDGTSQRTLTSENRGRAPALSRDGRQYAFIEYVLSTREEVLRISSIQGDESQLASSYWGGTNILSDLDMPAWSPDGFWLAFIAQGTDATQPDLYRLSLLNPLGDPTALERLTYDAAIESWPTYSPDGTRIAYVADLREIEVFDNPIDLRVIDLTTSTITDLTTNGADLEESAPDWSPSGSYIVFQGKERDGGDWDIYRMPVTGSGEPEKIIDSDADDIRPRYAPDGTHIVFTSNRSGNWDVFVYNLNTEEIYQITNNRYDDIANDWSN